MSIKGNGLSQQGEAGIENSMEIVVIPSSLREEISEYLGSSPKPYVAPVLDASLTTGCEYWDLPAQKEEDKPVSVRYQEILQEVASLLAKDKADPRIEELITRANGLVDGVRASRKFGTAVFSMGDLLRLDPRKGIRKEWWELHERSLKRGACVFQGYRAVDAVASRNGDILIAMPGDDPYDFLRIHRTRGNNHPISTAGIVAALKKLDAEYGVTIVAAAEDAVEFVLERSVEAKSAARIRQRLKRLCPSAESLSEGIRLGRVTLWWD